MRLGGKVFLLPSRITLPCKYQQFCVCHHSWNLLPWLYFLPCSLVGKRNVQPIVQGAGVTGRRLRLQPLTPRLPFHPLCKALSLIQVLESRFVSHHRLENRRLGGCQALKKKIIQLLECLYLTTDLSFIPITPQRILITVRSSYSPFLASCVLTTG